MLTQETHIEEVPLKRLVLDKNVQMRDSLSQVAIQEYADLMAEGEEFPPIVAFGRVGGTYYVADGFHRVEAKRRLKAKTITVELRDGGKREAMLYAMRANANHGVRRTNADKQRSVQTCLNDKEWVKWTDSEIARRCAVSVSIVSRLRELMGNKGRREVRTYIDTSGNLRTRTVPYRQPKTPDELALENKAARCPYCGHELPKNLN